MRPLLVITAKLLGYIVLLPVSYGLIALVLTSITVNDDGEGQGGQDIYLHTNGVHLDIVVPINGLDRKLLEGLEYSYGEQYFSFGWGDENFYLNTPTWADLTFESAFRALFLKSSSLIHLTRYRKVHSDWVGIKVTKGQLEKLNGYLLDEFMLDNDGRKILLKNKGYRNNDDFYKATSSYSCFFTCNTWVNDCFKKCGLKACLWTPFDFGLMGKYEKEKE